MDSTRYTPTCASVLQVVITTATIKNYAAITPDHVLHGLFLIDSAARKMLIKHAKEDTVLQVCAGLEPPRLPTHERHEGEYRQPSEELSRLLQDLEDEVQNSRITVLHLLRKMLKYVLDGSDKRLRIQLKSLGISREKMVSIIEDCEASIRAYSKVAQSK